MSEIFVEEENTVYELDEGMSQKKRRNGIFRNREMES